MVIENHCDKDIFCREIKDSHTCGLISRKS